MTVAFAARPLPAQVVEWSGGLDLVEFQVTDQGRLRYEYALTHPGERENRNRWTQIDLAITAPRDGDPLVLGGDLLFDALAEDDQLPGHPPLFVETPEGWHAAISVRGVVTWQAGRAFGHYDHALGLGETLAGFALESPALPAYRLARVIPYRRPNAPGFQAQTDTTLRVLQRYVVAPGWPAEQVEGRYFADQVEAACAAGGLGRCDPLRGAAQEILATEQTGSDRTYFEAIDHARTTVMRLPGSERIAVYVLTSALDALLARPPSVR